MIRGEAYNIDGKNFFVFGGAGSHDKEHRTEGKNWWKEELPNEQEYFIAENTLKKNDLKFDYIITHSAPTSVQTEIAPTSEINELTDFLENIKNHVICKKWFFGHYHRDTCVNEKYIAIFNSIYKI